MGAEAEDRFSDAVCRQCPVLSSSRLTVAPSRTAKKKVKSISTIGSIAREYIAYILLNMLLVKIWLIRSNSREPSMDTKFVVVSARKSRGAGHWDKDGYNVRLGDGSGPVVGRIMRHPQAPEGQPWFWTVTAREQNRHRSIIAATQRATNRQCDILRRGGWRDSEANLIFNWIASGSLLFPLFGQ